MQQKKTAANSLMLMSNSLNYIIFECQVIRKHFFLNRKYYLKLTSKELTMSIQPLQQQPKYIYMLKIDKIFKWILQENQIIGFLIPYMDKIKDFFGKPEEMVILKEKMGPFICYEKIERFYKRDQTLQSGSFGKVTKEICKFTNRVVAIKSIKIQQNSVLAITNEIEILQKLKKIDSPNILQIYEIFRDESYYYLITEYIDGINLQQYISARQKPCITQESLFILKSILEGVHTIHSANIIHRDLKPANLMIQGNYIKIIDFGLACFNGKQLEQFPTCGTSGYSAPEVLNVWNKKQPYDLKADLFSVGCIFYKLLTLENIFQSDNEKETYNNNKRCLINITERGSTFDLAKLFLKSEPSQRINSSQALQLVQSMIEFRFFDVNLWYNAQFNQQQKGKSQCDFDQEAKIKYSKQCSLVTLPYNEIRTERQNKMKF